MKAAKWIFALAVVLAAASLAGANPIPWPPPASMPLEDMYSILSVNDYGRLTETFYGDYYFSKIPPDVYMMKYPLPPDSSGISVVMGKLPEAWQFVPSMLPYIHESIPDCFAKDWFYIRELYPTVLPEWPGIPMIAWNEPFAEKALLRVKYQHDLLMRGRDYVYFYALGTGKYSPTYQKEAISFLDITMPGHYNMHRLYLDKTPHAFAVTTEGKKTVVSIYAAAQFGPFTKDIIGLIRPWLVCSDTNYDDKTDLLDLIYVRNMLGRNPASDEPAADADVNGDGRVDILDLILIRNHLGERAEAVAAEPPQIRLRYNVKQCGSTTPPPGGPDVFAWGNRMAVSDAIRFNCCTEYVRMTILVDGNRVIFREKAMESAPCDCLCYYPMRGIAGPFAPGTYHVELVDPHGVTILEKDVVLPSTAVPVPVAE